MMWLGGVLSILLGEGGGGGAMEMRESVVQFGDEGM